MASTWQGENLRNRFAEKLGDTSTAFKARTLEWINDVQEDICGAYNWPFLRFKMKKLVAVGTVELDLSPEIPAAPSVAIAAGGSLTDASVYDFKCTFVLFDESGKEENSIESEPSPASGTVTASGANLQANLTAIPVMGGSTSVKPVTIWRRIYMRKTTGSTVGIFALVATIQDNTTTTLSVTANTSSTIEPPEYSMISVLSDDDPFIELSGRVLSQTTVDRIKSYDPSGSSGTPQDYARLGRERIVLYPAPSSAFTLSYYVYKRPARVFAEADRAIHMPPEMKAVLEAGVSWKGAEYRDRDGMMGKYELYEAMRLKAVSNFKRVNGKFGQVRDVEGDWCGREIS